MLTRREMIKLGVVSAPAILRFGRLRSPGWLLDGQDQPPSPPSTPFQSNLPIPKILEIKGTNPGVPGAAKEMRDEAIREAQDENRSMAPAAIDDADYYEVTIRQKDVQIPGLSAGPTRIWAYNGSTPGPTIVARRNRPVVVRFTNELFDEGQGSPFSVHYHGGHTIASSDGYPHDFTDQSGRMIRRVLPPFVPGQLPPSRVYVYPNTSTRGATLWYHDHFDMFNTQFHGTGHNVYFGLAAFFILQPSLSKEDDRANAVEKLFLPSGTPDPMTQSGLGRFDIPLVIQDRLFNPDGTLNYPPFEHDGVLGDTFLVNGAVQPRFSVEPRRYRLRILNGSNARVYQLAFSESGSQALNPLPFIQIGSDGGLLPRAVARDSFLISMAERFELVVDFSSPSLAGKSVYLVNCMQQTSGRGPDGVTPEACTPLVRFDVQISKSSEPEPPLTLQHLQELLPLTPEEDMLGMANDPTIIRRDFKFERSHGGWVINGEFFEPGRVSLDGDGFEARPRRDSVEIWRLINSSGGWVHPVHIHLEEFQILDRNGVPPSPEEEGLKDVFYLGHGDTVRVITKFRSQKPTLFALENGGEDNSGIYVFHCHNLEHEDMNMMGNFSVEG